jgi:PAS domain S-box-containing protein
MLKIPQAIPVDDDLENLVGTVTRRALEQAGVERGLLILRRGAAYQIQAEALAGDDGVKVTLRRSGVTPAELSVALFERAVGTGRPVVVHDAWADRESAHDGYAHTRRPRFVLCLPMSTQSGLVGLLYLESTRAARALTPAQMRGLESLASTAAEALGHACLSRELQEREARYRQLVDTNIIGINIWHADGRILDTNEEFLRIVGYSRDELLSGRVLWTALTPPEWHAKDRQGVERIRKGGVSAAHEREYIRKDGTRVPVLAGGAMFDGTEEGVAFVLDLTELKRAEQAVRLSERDSRLIVDTIPGLVVLLGPTGDVELISRQVVHYTGRSLEEMKLWRTNDVVHPQDLARVAEEFSRAIASGSPYQIVQRLRRGDGVYRWFRNSGVPLRGANGCVVRWCVLLTDFDDQKRAEDTIRASERGLQLIIDTIPALVWSANPDGSTTFFNQHYLDFMGLSALQARDSGWLAAVHPDDRDGLARRWGDVMASQQPGEIEARLRGKDGDYRWFLIRANPLRDDSGAIVQWYGINTDIEDRKRAEVQLKRAYDSFADGQRLSRTGNFTADITTDEHIWSEELYRIFEIDPATKISVQTVRGLIHPDDLPSFDAGFARSLGGVDFDHSFRIVGQRGSPKHVHAVGRLIELIAGRPLFIGAIRDVTEAKLAEEALNKARSELTHVARVTTLSTLTASIAHEVNQPLSGIVTNAGTCLRMLEAHPANIDGARETARRIIRDGNRAADVITRLRALFSKREFALEPLDLNEATREVIALSVSDLRRNRVVLQPELAEDLPAVTGDRIQLQQVILNLLRNASEAMAGVDDRPRQLLIRTAREPEDRVKLSVRDCGVGLDRQSMDKLFDAFYTTKSAGMGIGLSVSRSIVERHHGSLWAEPNDGPGATFAFHIPVGPVSARPPPSAHHP